MTRNDLPSLGRALLTLPLVALLGAALPDFPAAITDEQPKVEQQCLSYDSAYENAPLFVVNTGAGAERTWLYRQTRPCPKDKPCGSRQKAYLVNGDVVFAGPPNQGFRCAYYGRPNGKIVAGFIPIDDLQALPEDNRMSIDFVSGTWNYENDSIAIKAAAAGQVSGDGQASYQTAETVNEGSFSAQAPLSAGQKELVFKEGNDESSCVVKLVRRGPYLVASDNSNCGGLNVRFNGIYTRAKTK